MATKPKVVTLLQATYLARAECDVCNFVSPDVSARDEAKAHTIGTGHITRVTYETTTVYGRQDDGE